MNREGRDEGCVGHVSNRVQRDERIFAVANWLWHTMVAVHKDCSPYLLWHHVVEVLDEECLSISYLFVCLTVVTTTTLPTLRRMEATRA